MKSRKAQVTVFIILGIILLITAGSYLVIESGRKQIVEQEAVVEEVPVMFNPVKQFVENCIIKEAEEALIKIGNSGGYINLYDEGISANPNEPTESSSFMVFPGNKESSIAYWYYFKSSNRCRENCYCRSEKPDLYKSPGKLSIEGQLEDYINNNLRNCLDDFRAFDEQGFNIKELGAVNSDATITDEIKVGVEYPLEIKKQNTGERIERFYVTIPLNLRKLYELAEGIANAEEKFMYIDRWTIEEISGFSFGLDENNLPPLSDSSFKPGTSPVTWKKTEVMEKIKNNMLPYYTSLFQVYGTANYEEKDVVFYQRTTLPIVSTTGTSYEDLEVRFEYLNYWPIYFDITGRGVRGEVIGPESAAISWFDWVLPRRYDFYYDISYPVKVDIYDKNALNNRGYHFVFGLEANVRDNKALNCSSREKEVILGPTTSMLCEENKRCAKVTIETLDAKYNTRLDGVGLFYGTSEGCDIGVVDGLGEISLPQCFGSGCSLLASKAGYRSYPVSYSVNCYTSESCGQENVLCDNEKLTVKLEPYRTKEFRVKKKIMWKNTNDGAWNFKNEPLSLLDNEYVMITLDKIKENPNEEEFTIGGLFRGNESKAFLERIIPGKYNARLNLIYELPDSAGRKEVVFKGDENTEDVKLEDDFAEGGAEFELNLDKNDLDIDDIIEFYVISTIDSSSFNYLSVDDLGQMGRAGELSETYKEELKPGFIKK